MFDRVLNASLALTIVIYRVRISTEQNFLLRHFMQLFSFMSMLFSIAQDYKEYQVLLSRFMLLLSFYTP